MKKTGLYIGRFQPFHLGHLSAIKQALKQVDFLIIGIGSAQYSGTPKNPYTAKERKAMIRAALKEANISEDKCQITPIPDIHHNAAWPAHVRKLAPPFEVVFVGDAGLVKELFETYDTVPVKTVIVEKNIRATQIRKKMRTSQDWQKDVPTAVKNLLEP